VLLANLPVAVVPVAIDGTHDALPVGRRWPRLRRLSVHFGKPLEPEAFADDDADAIVERLHRALARLLDERDG
jgi:1-acyl-sn-glycerol-3-phosphate acyltransferase